MMKKVVLRNGKELIIRIAVKEDAKQIVDYINQVGGESDFLTFGQDEFTATVEEEEKFIESYQGVSNKLFIVAEIAGKIVSSLSFTGGMRPRIQHVGEFGITVLRDFWGQGIARAMVVYMIDWAKASDMVKKINLRVRIDNHKAIKLYQSLGFQIQGTNTREFLIDREFFDSYFMGLEID